MLTDSQQFKFGFLLSCADQGLSLHETHGVVKSALAELTKAADDGPVSAGMALAKLPGEIAGSIAKAPINATKGVASTLWNVGWPLALAAGIGAATLTDSNQETPEETQSRELIEEYKRYADRARQNTALQQSRMQGSRRGRPLI